MIQRTARIVRPNGDLRARGVTPDIAIPIPAVETPADEVLQRAVVIARESQARQKIKKTGDDWKFCPAAIAKYHSIRVICVTSLVATFLCPF